jgi:Spy/CpxP family protein refolding chaperone
MLEEAETAGENMAGTVNGNKAEKLELLRKREAQIKAQIAALESAQKSKQRKEDTRLKVLLGAAMLADTAIHPETRAGIEALLERAITAARDRDFLKSKGWLQ